MHWALKRFNKHLTRIVVISVIAYLFVLLHPTPTIVQVIVFLWTAMILWFAIGVSVASRLIVRGERQDINKN